MNTNLMKRGMSASTLKILAMVVMLIDHVALAVLIRILKTSYNQEWYQVYQVMRGIGRNAFPIYCFLLIEGLEHTRNKWKYALRLFLFALISEIPFDLAFKSQVFAWEYQNVFFTLVLGLLLLILIKEIERRCATMADQQTAYILQTCLSSAATIGIMVVAYLLKTDYSYKGIFCIFILYYFRKNKWLQLVLGYLAFVGTMGEIAALPAFLFLATYKGEKGMSCKYLFYTFYPAHLLILYLICAMMGLSGISPL